MIVEIINAASSRLRQLTLERSGFSGQDGKRILIALCNSKIPTLEELSLALNGSWFSNEVSAESSIDSLVTFASEQERLQSLSVDY